MSAPRKSIRLEVGYLGPFEGIRRRRKRPARSGLPAHSALIELLKKRELYNCTRSIGFAYARATCTLSCRSLAGARGMASRAARAHSACLRLAAG